MHAARNKRFLFFSGGTALNSYVQEIRRQISHATFVIPVSDDGGSSGEILRVLGGPAIGDIRSRLIRLSDGSTNESAAVQQLLMHRLPSDAHDALREWLDIVTGRHTLWTHISEAYKETIRAFLCHFHAAVLSRAAAGFDWTGGSVGNFFFTGARLFFHSLPAAIFWFSRTAMIPPSYTVLPVINNNNRIGLGAFLRDGTIIHGQSNISHPGKQVIKTGCAALPSPIDRIFYLNEYMQPYHPPINGDVLQKLSESDVVVYAIGSLYTSVLPNLILRGVGERVAEMSGSPKVLLLNSYPDRETDGMDAMAFALAVQRALNRDNELQHPLKAYVTHVIVAEQSQIKCSESDLIAEGIHVSQCKSVPSENGPIFATKELVQQLLKCVDSNRADVHNK